ncbi:S1 domain-containing RNA-binding protein [Lacticaseibacillus baoqingensis]|uniref:S1 domain-containing RNA-binding protein n=1 Tax=Lacticaseibacillus baoqingensis TaxID=2486013 RepID=A0ABW4E8C4_9LACO|nr:S1 domain-containing RNA-binding protein [Lacticaseibacillus baoqingensis]
MAVEVGAKVSGKVTGITNFGAFVDLGESKTGLVHISEISDSYVKDIHDVLSVGDTVTVKVMQIKDGKIGLSIRKAQDQPQGEHAQHGHGGPAQPHFQKPHHDNNHSNSRPVAHATSHKQPADKSDFDSMMSGFLKESEDRLSSLRRNTEGKRGGRGGRRS